MNGSATNISETKTMSEWVLREHFDCFVHLLEEIKSQSWLLLLVPGGCSLRFKISFGQLSESVGHGGVYGYGQLFLPKTARPPGAL